MVRKLAPVREKESDRSITEPSPSKDRRKTISSLVLLLVVWIPISMAFKPNHPVTEEEMRKYGETYIATFRDLVYQFNPKDRTYFLMFSQFWDRVSSLQATISETHGAAIEFIRDSTSSTFQARRSDERIEVAIFNGVFRRVKPAGVFGELPLRISKLRVIFSIGSPAIFDTGGVCLFEVFDNASLVVLGSDWTLNDVRYTNPITMKGSNMYEAWTVDKAIQDAEFGFKYDLADALNGSDGVRQYVAYDDLKERLNEIAYKLKNDLDYGGPRVDSDLEELSRIALEKYGVTKPDFINRSFAMTLQKQVLIKRLPIIGIAYHDNLWYTVLFSIAIDVTYVLGTFVLPWLARYVRRKKLTPLSKIARELIKTLTVPVVFGYFWVSAPFDYSWLTHFPVVLVQFAICVSISTFSEGRRLEFRPNWRRVLPPILVGTVFLIIFLASTPFWIRVFFNAPSMFSSLPIGIGHVTPLSILVATMSVLVVLVSQRIYGRFTSSHV